MTTTKLRVKCGGLAALLAYFTLLILSHRAASLGPPLLVGKRTGTSAISFTLTFTVAKVGSTRRGGWGRWGQTHGGGDTCMKGSLTLLITYACMSAIAKVGRELGRGGGFNPKTLN